jgi:Domain of unknown function (DUF4062)
VVQDNKRHQVFISSTYLDLREERQKVSLALMQMDCIPAGMELFPAADDEQFEFIKRVIDDCDYYVVIVGARYGCVTADGLSYTEKEFDYANGKGKPICAFLHHDPNSIPVKDADIDPVLRDRLEQFKEKLKTGRLISTWSNSDDLAGKVVLSLQKTIKLHPRPGWIRGDAIAETEALKDLTNIHRENADLRQQLEALKATIIPKRKVTDSPLVSVSFSFDNDRIGPRTVAIGLERWLLNMGAPLATGLSSQQFYGCVREIICREQDTDAKIFPSVADIDKLKTVFLAFDLVEIRETSGDFGQDQIISLTAQGKVGLMDCVMEVEKRKPYDPAAKLAERLSRPTV